MYAIAIATAVISAIQTASKVAPIVIDGINNAKPFAIDLWNKLTGGPPSAVDEATLDALLAALSTKLEAPLPPAQPGDPDYKA
jgi:hypothetical protein